MASTGQLAATVLPADATNKNVNWSSNNTAAATVNSSGLVTAVGVGSAVITATSAADSSKKGTCAVTVQAPAYVPVTGISLNATDVELNSANGWQYQLVPTITPANATNKNVLWFAIDPGVNVTADGLVSASRTYEEYGIYVYCVAEDSVAGAGDSSIGFDFSESAVCIFYIDNSDMTGWVDATGITLTSPQDYVWEGETLQLTATVTPANATPKPTYIQSDNSYFYGQVLLDGKLRGLLAGGAVGVYAYADNESSSVSSAVKIIQVYGTVPRRVVVSGTAGEIPYGGTKQLTATVYPVNLAAAQKTVTWSSNNTAAATVNSSGLVTAVGGGSATITATSTVDGSVKGTYAVTAAGAFDVLNWERQDYAKDFRFAPYATTNGEWMSGSDYEYRFYILNWRAARSRRSRPRWSRRRAARPPEAARSRCNLSRKGSTA